MNTIIVFLIGLSVGTFAGIAIMALMVMAGRDEEKDFCSKGDKLDGDEHE